MNLKKGISRIVGLILWLFLGVWFEFYLILPAYLPTLKLSGYFTCLVGFFLSSVSLAVLLIYVSNRVFPVNQRFLNLDDLYTKVIVTISIIVGLFSVWLLYFLARSYPDGWMRIDFRAYALAFVIGSLSIFSPYVFIRWIVKGFCD